MLPVADIALRQIEIYSIIFFRISGIVVMMPFFGSDNVPRLVKIVHNAGEALGFQVIMISHHDVAAFRQYADKIYRFHEKGNG